MSWLFYCNNIYGYINDITGEHHVALVKGDIGDGKDVLCRVHCLFFHYSFSLIYIINYLVEKNCTEINTCYSPIDIVGK